MEIFFTATVYLSNRLKTFSFNVLFIMVKQVV